MTRGDALVVAAVILLACASIPIAMAGASVRPDGVIVTGPAGTTVIDLNAPGTYLTEGRSGTVAVQVSGGRASVIAAECPDGICVRSGDAQSGRPIVCAPNGVSVELAVGGGDGLDAISR